MALSVACVYLQSSKAWLRAPMSVHQNQHQLVDLLEVYHARELRQQLLREIRRLRDGDAFLPGSSDDRRRRTSAFYENMLLECSHLLDHLGDYG